MALAAATRPKLTYRLTDPGYTIYHRAALGGLAATIKSWAATSPAGITASFTNDTVQINWTDELSDQDALRSILRASFKLTPDKMIDLPGQNIPSERADLRLAVHVGITQTFLQHPKSRPGDKEPLKFILRSVDDDSEQQAFTYKGVNSYAHQTAQGTGLLEGKATGRFPKRAFVPQAIIPGALSGATPLDSSPEEVILLHFLLVGCTIFHLRSKQMEEKTQYCLVVPDVSDLIAFARSLHRIVAAGPGFRVYSNTLTGRVVGGMEEAALRFIVDMHAAQAVASERSISGCQAIAMGRVAWDSNQINRSRCIRIRTDYPELDIFRAANQYLGQSRIINTKKGDSYVVPSTWVPELVAANLATDRHWCSGFFSLVSQQQSFKHLTFARGGLIKMKNAIRDSEDIAVINAFHDAWRRMLGALYERAKRDGLHFDRLAEVERERTRNSILRAKTSEALSGWFLRFCADATHGGSLVTLRDDAPRIREFIFNPRHFERFQNLCLFALLSYESKATAEGGQ